MRSLFDPPIAATADPDTSHQAADRITRSGRRQAHCEIVLALVGRFPGSTSVELFEEQQSLDRHEISRRLADLAHAGKVRRGPVGSAGR